jgi:hypothetical protein
MEMAIPIAPSQKSVCSNKHLSLDRLRINTFTILSYDTVVKNFRINTEL